MKEVTKNTRPAPNLLLVHLFPVQFLEPSFVSKVPIKVWCDVSLMLARLGVFCQNNINCSIDLEHALNN
jgi:hypothetical protein